jgi:hypothetical protein
MISSSPVHPGKCSELQCPRSTYISTQILLAYFLEVLVTFTSQMYFLRPSLSLPMEVLGMIAKEADDEDLPAQRLVCSLWPSVTATEFASLFHETAFEFSRAGTLNLLALCND